MVRKKSKRSRKAEHLMSPYVGFNALTRALLADYLKPSGNVIKGRPDFPNKVNDNLVQPFVGDTDDPEEQKRIYLDVLRRLDQAKYYEVDRNLSKHLANTQPLDVSKEENFDLPFDRMFVSTNIRIDTEDTKATIKGMLLSKRELYVLIADENQIRISSEMRDDVGNHPLTGYEVSYRIDFDNGNNYINNSLIIFSYKSVLDKVGEHGLNGFDIQSEFTTLVVKNYLINLVAFLTLKERVLVKRDRTNSYERRKEKGYLPIPSSTLITCDNKTKEYFTKYQQAIDSGAKGVSKHHRIAFWREYKHKKYKHVPIITRPDGKVGKWQWIKPTIVGDGLYIPKHRRVKA